MHRILVDSVLIESDSPELPREAVRHLNVVRPKDGEAIELFDGCGRTRLYRYSAAVKRIVASGDALYHERSGRAQVLFACVTKGQRWDWTIQKATELGATRIVPVLSERTIVRIARGEREEKRARWQKIAEEAARQSSAVWLPEIAAPVDFSDAAALARGTLCFVGALVTPPPPMLLDAVLDAKTSGALEQQAAVSLFVGPEGDFTPGELDALLEFASPTSFGPFVLRAETAAIYGLTVISAALHNKTTSSGATL